METRGAVHIHSLPALSRLKTNSDSRERERGGLNSERERLKPTELGQYYSGLVQGSNFLSLENNKWPNWGMQLVPTQNGENAIPCEFLIKKTTTF